MRIHSYAVSLLGVLGSTDAFTPSKPLLFHRSPSIHSPPRPWTQVLSVSSNPQENDATTTDTPPVAPFVNDGPFKIMQKGFDVMGFEEGKTVVIAKAITVDESQFPTEEQSAEMRESAKEKMTNIGTYEQERRRVVGNVGLSITAVYAVWASLADLDDVLGHFTRLAVLFPLALGLGYKRSADAGL